MYNVVFTIERPVASIPYYRNSSNVAKAQVDALVAARKTAPGYVEEFTVFAPDKLSSTVTQIWADKQSYDNYNAANVTALNELNTARSAYEAAHGFTRVVQTVGV